MRGIRNLKALLSISVLLPAMVCTATGKTIFVDDDATGANDGSSWVNAYNYLQDALSGAVSADEIRVAQGTYKPDQGGGEASGDRTATFQLITGVALKGGYAGLREPNPDARDIQLHETILSGDLLGNDVKVNDPCDLLTEPTRAENSYHVVTGSGTDETAILDGFTITAGYANSLDPRFDGGGGMYNNDGSPTLTNCTFTSNFAHDGGGMGNEWSSPTLTNCTFSGNRGGGMCNEWSSPTLTNCTFSSNSAGEGGGMDNSHSSPTLTDCTFSSNSAVEGGGMHNSQSSPTLTTCIFSGNSSNWDGGGMKNLGGRPTLIDCTFSENSAGAGTMGGGGGGIWNFAHNLTVTNCTFSGNSAGAGSTGGGGICNRSNMTLTNCIFSSNSAGRGSGGGMKNSWGGRVTVTKCNFTGNTARGFADGGGICNETPTELTVTDCIFSGNTAGSGGGIASGGTRDISNCTFSGNSAERNGGGMLNWSSNLTLTNCTFSGNSAEQDGGGMCNSGSNLTVTNCTFSGNSAEQEGGGMWNIGSSPTLTNCTFSGNSAEQEGGGMSNIVSSPTLTNCILWGNVGAQISGAAIVTYSDVQGGWPGEGNKNANPLFLDPDGDDNIIGTNDDNLRLMARSPCIDAGDNSAVPISMTTDLDGNPRILNGTVDMGAYEGAKPGGQQRLLLSVTSLTVPEGETATFTVVPAIDPHGILEVTVAVESGDPDITVKSGASLSFNSSNYTVAQTVTLAAAEDADWFNGSTVIAVSGEGLTSATIDANELDNDRFALLYVDNDATGANTGQSWADAFNYLQDALSLATAFSEVQEIRVAEGVYTPDSNSAFPNGTGDRKATFQLASALRIKGGYAGSGHPDPNARNVGLYETILSGDLDGNDVEVSDPGLLSDEPTRAENSFHVVTVSGTNTTAVIDGFTIVAGNADGYWPYYCDGGGIYNESNLTVTNCTFSKNSAGCGGGIYSLHGSLTATNCTFSGNEAKDSGGGMSNASSYASPTLTNCTFSRNWSKSGGGMRNVRCLPVKLTNCRFTANSAEENGGGLYSERSSPKLTNCILTGNTAGSHGGAMYDYQWSPRLTNCTLSGNSADLGGGGIYSYGSNLTVINCILWGNTAGYGPQITLEGTPESDPMDPSPPPPARISTTWSNFEGGEADVFVADNDLIWWLDCREIIDAEPLFVKGPLGNYYLSQIAAGQSVDSPCVDAGSDSAANVGMDRYTTRTDIITDAAIVDMGYHYPPEYRVGDIDRDWDVDFHDYPMVAGWWMNQNCTQPTWCDGADVNKDGKVDFRDIKDIAEHWLEGIGP